MQQVAAEAVDCAEEPWTGPAARRSMEPDLNAVRQPDPPRCRAVIYRRKCARTSGVVACHHSAMDSNRAQEVMTAMVAMFASGDPSEAAEFVDVSYLDHQGLGDGPLRGVDGFAFVVRTNCASYQHLDVRIEDPFATGDRVAARISGRVGAPTANTLPAKPSTSFGSSMAEPSSIGALPSERSEFV